MFSLQEIRRAHEVVLQALRPTPALNWPLLDERLGDGRDEGSQPLGVDRDALAEEVLLAQGPLDLIDVQQGADPHQPADAAVEAARQPVDRTEVQDP